MAYSDSKPRPNGPQGKAGKSSFRAPIQGGRPRSTEDAGTAPDPMGPGLTKPMKAPGSGTRGRGNTATPPRG